MARLTAEELAAAKRTKQALRDAAQQALDDAEDAKWKRLDDLEQQEDTWRMLTNVLVGHYDEVDKLCKKAPAEEITELLLKRVNQLIGQTKLLLRGDPFIDTIDVFVPAGDLPELRDVLIILRELKQGLTRWDQLYRKLKDELEPHGWKRRG